MRQMQHVEESAVAGATQDATPRIAILLSSFRGGSEHDGSRIAGLRDPQPMSATLSPAQVDAMVRKAIDLSHALRGRIEAFLEPNDWVLILCATAPRIEIVRSLLSYLAGKKTGARFSVSSPACARLCAELSRKYPRTRFETCDLAAESRVEMPVPWTRGRKSLAPATFQRCDKIVSLAPLAIAPTFANYLRLAGPGASTEALVDFYSLHPPDFAFAGGDRNILIAGAKPVAVDAVASAVLGARPAAVACLQLAYKRGLGTHDLDSIWTRGSEIEEAARALREDRL
jgi:hypothetical protein